MWKGKKVSVVFSTYNEKETIRGVIEALFKTGYVDEVIAVDNNAVSGTKEEILKTKAKYFHEPKQGIGAGYKRALDEATGDLIITIEVDGTYVARDVVKLLAYSDDFDMVCGTRTTSIMIGRGASMGAAVKWANWLYAKMIEVLFNTPNLTDVGCLYRLISKKAYDRIRNVPIDSKNSFTVDWMLYVIRNRISFIEAPVNFKRRVGRSYGAYSTYAAAKVALQMLVVIIKHLFNLKKRNVY
jgi:glycosyltransferase involved in cell wall biosynthesis